VPPQAAFNNKRVLKAKFEDIISLGPDETPQNPRYQQGGAWMYTLCAKCNNLTGKWYGGSFVDWSYQGMSILLSASGRPSLVYLYHIFPLRVIKQIATMFFSVNNDRFGDGFPDLASFVLNRQERSLSPFYRFFAYYKTGSELRYAARLVKANTRRGQFEVFSEIAFPPFGYVLTFDSEPPDSRLYEITHFAKYAYNDWCDQELRLPVLETHLPGVPGDYRTKEQIMNDYSRNKSQYGHPDSN
jgi:hypothetical protein